MSSRKRDSVKGRTRVTKAESTSLSLSLARLGREHESGLLDLIVDTNIDIGGEVEVGVGLCRDSEGGSNSQDSIADVSEKKDCRARCAYPGKSSPGMPTSKILISPESSEPEIPASILRVPSISPLMVVVSTKSVTRGGMMVPSAATPT